MHYTCYDTFHQFPRVRTFFHIIIVKNWYNNTSCPFFCFFSKTFESTFLNIIVENTVMLVS